MKNKILSNCRKYNVCFIDIPDDLTSYIFVRKDFIDYQSSLFSMQSVCIGVFSEDNQSLLAYCSLTGDGEYWQSPVTGAFGGVVNKKNTPVAALDFLIESIPFMLSSNYSMSSIQFKLPPGCFLDDSALIANILYRKKWHLESLDVNYHLQVCSTDEYLANLGETKRKIIRRLDVAGALFEEVDYSLLEKLYSVIEQNRSAQGYPMTMSLEAMSNLVKSFKNDIRLFLVRINSQVIASAICLEVSKKYLYIFYWGELKEFRKESPVTLLAKGIMNFCFINGFQIMDIGTSSLHSELNPGLCSFKSSLGCNITHKMIYKWESKGA